MWTRTHAQTSCSLASTCKLCFDEEIKYMRPNCLAILQFSPTHYFHHLRPLSCISTGSSTPRRQVAKRSENTGIWAEETETQIKTPIGKAAVQTQQLLDLFSRPISTSIMLKSTIIQAFPGSWDLGDMGESQAYCE